MGQKKKQVHIFISNLFNIRFRIITSSTFRFSKWSFPSSFSNWSCLWISHPLYVCHVTAVWLKTQVCWQVTLIGWTNSSRSLQGSVWVYLLGPRSIRINFFHCLWHYFPTGRRNLGRPLKRLLDTWDRNGSTSGPTPWKICDDDYYYLMTWIFLNIPCGST